MASDLDANESLSLWLCLFLQSVFLFVWFRNNHTPLQFSCAVRNSAASNTLHDSANKPNCCRRWRSSAKLFQSIPSLRNVSQAEYLHSKASKTTITTLLFIFLCFSGFHLVLHKLNLLDTNAANDGIDGVDEVTRVWVLELPVLFLFLSHFLLYGLVLFRLHTFWQNNFYFFARVSSNSLQNLQRWLVVLALLFVVLFDFEIVFSVIRLSIDTANLDVNSLNSSILKVLVKTDCVASCVLSMFVLFKQTSLKALFKSYNLELIFAKIEQLSFVCFANFLLCLAALFATVTMLDNESDASSNWLFVRSVVLPVCNVLSSFSLIVAFDAKYFDVCCNLYKKLPWVQSVSPTRRKFGDLTSVRVDGSASGASGATGLCVREMQESDIASVLYVIETNEEGDVSAAKGYFEQYFAAKKKELQRSGRGSHTSRSSGATTAGSVLSDGRNAKDAKDGRDANDLSVVADAMDEEGLGVHFVCSVTDGDGMRVLGVNGVYKNERVHESVDVWWLGWFYVMPAEQGKGIGQMLWDKTLEYCRDRKDCRKIYVDVSGMPEYTTAKKFYIKNGFVVEGVLKDFYDKDDDQFVMGLTV